MIALVALISSGICGLFFSCCDSNTQYSPVFSEDTLHEGDVVFRRGRSMVSRFILVADNDGNYSHIGIIVYHDNKWKVIHAVPGEPDYEGDKDRVKMDDVTVFFKDEYAKSGAIMRFNNDSIAQNAATRALAIYERVTLFDHQYNLEDSTQMYCTEMIHFVFDKSGIDLTEGRRSRINAPALSGTYIFPSDIERNPRLKLIDSF